MKLNFEAPQKNKLLALDKYDFQKAEEVMLERDAKIAKSIANDIIPDPAPQEHKRVELKFEAPQKNELLALYKYGTNGKDESITVRSKYPQYHVPCFQLTEDFDYKEAKKVMLERDFMAAKSIPNDIIIPDPASQEVCHIFSKEKFPKLEPILVKDSVQSFLRFFENSAGRGMSWDLTITSQTLTCIVNYNALRCSKVVLEGVAPQLRGMHANPNCINNYGFFALHEAAERFSVDMIKLLLRHGASPNVRTVGKDIIENLLPLHVAVENTCMHKYLEDNLEDNLSRSQNHLDYIYKLLHLLCLPEMKIFLDTTRLLAENTNNLLQELWNYIEGGKIIQAAQEQIRGCCSSKIKGSSKKKGLTPRQMAVELLEERKTLLDCAWLLVDVISHAGEDLSAYIQVHSEPAVSLQKVRRRVMQRAYRCKHGSYRNGQSGCWRGNSKDNQIWG